MSSLRRILPVASLALLLTGCTIQLSPSRSTADGGMFRSEDYGEHWTQRVYVGQSGNRAVTIGDVDVASMVFSPHDSNEMTITTFANGVFRSFDAGTTWRALHLPASYYPVFAYDPKITAIQYTARGNTILKTTTNDESWDIIYTESRGHSITAVAVDPKDSSIVYAGTSGGTLLKSVDYGTDWFVTDVIADQIRSITFDPTDSRIVYVALVNNGIVRTRDAGVQWEPLTTLTAYGGAGHIHQFLITPYDPATLYVASDHGLLVSKDRGDTWSEVTTLIPFNAVPYRSMGVDVVDPKILYFTVNNLLHKSEDGGLTWRTIETIPTGRLIIRFASHPEEPGVLYLGTFRTNR